MDGRQFMKTGNLSFIFIICHFQETPELPQFNLPSLSDKNFIHGDLVMAGESMPAPRGWENSPSLPPTLPEILIRPPARLPDPGVKDGQTGGRATT